MKFYYNGKLVRTSANHIYTHAVIKGEKNGKYLVEGCRANKEAAEQIITSRINWCKGNIKDAENAIKALENGESGYWYTFRGTRWFNKFTSRSTVEIYKESIEMNLRDIEQVKNNWKVVELEAREK